MEENKNFVDNIKTKDEKNLGELTEEQKEKLDYFFGKKGPTKELNKMIKHSVRRRRRKRH